MFFSKIVAFAALPLLAVALPGGITTVTVTAPASSETGGSTCSTGSIQCCDSVQSSESASESGLLGLLGVVVGDITGLVGLGCSPISVIGLSGGTCSSNAVCCEDNSSDNLISLGCIPITL